MSGIAVYPQQEDGFVRKKWRVEECRQLTQNGLLSPGRYELIEGEILEKMGQGRIHIFVVGRIIAILSAIFGGDSIQSQAQIGIGAVDPHNDPEPDVAVLQGTLHDYLNREPDPATEVLLVVEVSHTTLHGDTTTKARLYSTHGIPEYWVVAIPHNELIVYRQPTPNGYAHIQNYRLTDSVAPLSAPTATIQIASLLP